ncbi:hypothetical protein [Streptomyces noursei]|uniref:hypothetical protein n=1 Tax=Streptomyces noursei TaxID=1971 RepID=UPI0030B8322F
MADPTNGPAQAAPDTPDAAPEPAPQQAPEAVEPAEPAGPRPLGLAVTPPARPRSTATCGAWPKPTTSR